MPTHKESRPKRRPPFQRQINRQTNQPTFPSPSSINSKLLILPKLLLLFLLNLFSNIGNCFSRSLSYCLICIKKSGKQIRYKLSMMIKFIIQVAYPYFQMSHKLLANSDIRISDECCQIINIIAWLVEVFYWYGVRITKPYQILKNKRIIFP